MKLKSFVLKDKKLILYGIANYKYEILSNRTHFHTPLLLFRRGDENKLNANNNDMAIEIITKEDLQLFRIQLLNDLKSLIQIDQNKEKKHLRSSQVRKLLNISAGTLQNLRISGTLNPVKVGGIFYYSSAEIEALLQSK